MLPITMALEEPLPEELFAAEEAAASAAPRRKKEPAEPPKRSAAYERIESPDGKVTYRKVR